MRSDLIRLFVFFLVASATPAVSASTISNVRFQHLSREDGLSQAQVYNVVQDRQGYMWFGTQEGLNRFDGYDIKLFLHDLEDPSSISDNVIRTILVDRNGILWVGTDNGGLSMYNSIDESFINYKHTGAPGSISINRVRALFEDSQGNFWVGTDGAGLELFDRRSGQFLPAESTGAQFTSQHIWAISEDEYGNLWVGTEDGLNRFNPATKSVTRYAHDPLDTTSLSGNHIKSLLQDHDGNLWIGTDSAGLDQYRQSAQKADTGLFHHYVHEPGNNSSLSDNRITSLLLDSRGELWVGTFNGLNALSDDQSGFERYNHDLTNRYSIAHNIVMSIYQDRGGVLWVGTYDGLSRWNQATATMGHFTVRAEDEDSLSNATITSFAEGDAGEIWVGTFGGGLNRFDPASMKFERVGVSSSDGANLGDDQVMALHVDRSGNLWVGTRSSGVGFRKKGENKFDLLQHDSANANSLSANTITSILQDATGNIWIGTYTGGLNRLDPGTGEITQYRHAAETSSSISSDRIMVLFEDSDDILWIGTHGGGLNLFNSKTDTFYRFQFDPDNPNSISGNNVLAISEDDLGNLWIGTQSRGLNRWRPEDRRNGTAYFHRYSESNGLASPTVYATVMDSSGRLWLSSNRGLSRLDIETETFKHFDTSHGLQGAEFNLGAALMASDGRLYFGGINGFNLFDPDSLAFNYDPPEVVITSIATLNQPIEQLQTAIQQGLELSYEDYLIEFQFAGLDFSAPERNRYRYKLEGLDDEWVDAGNRRYASFTNLAPGDYTFMVMAANYDGVWSNSATRVPIKVAPPPWFTWYAYLSYLFLFTVFGWVVFSIQREKMRHVDEVFEINKMLEIEIAAGKGKEVALEREKEKAQSYLEIADIIMVVIDRDGRVQLINQKGCQALGLNEFQIVGQPWLEFVHSESKSDMKRWLSGDFSDDIQTHYECSLVSVDYKIHLIMWRFASLPDETGEGEFLLASGMDVTDKRELEKTIRVREKLAAVGTMASGIAHDFNNILTAINGYSLLAINELTSDTRPKEYLERVMEATQRASDLVARLLSFTNLEEQNLLPCDLGPVLREAATLLRGSLSSTIDISVDIHAGLLPVNADPTQIHQLLMNLGTNAGKAMQGRVGLLEIQADTVDKNTADLPASLTFGSGDYLRLVVRDNGIGMNEDILGTIFDPFFTTTGLGYGDKKGTGLGLSVAHGIVSGHSGQIDVRSRPGKGTTFTVVLPCCTEQVVPHEDMPKVRSKRSARVLIVDDEEWVADISKQLLQLLGYSTTNYLDPVEALAEFKRRPHDFDLVISDQNMPHMLGTELASEIRKINSTVPIILMSGNTMPATAADSLTTHMKKPFTIEELHEHVDESLSG